MFRISKGTDTVIDVAQIDKIEPAIRSSEPLRCHVDEISAGPLPAGHTPRRWGVALKMPDGSVVIEPDPWKA
jgi:hypothetical protein